MSEVKAKAKKSKAQAIPKHLAAKDLPTDTFGGLGAFRSQLLEAYNTTRKYPAKQKVLADTLKVILKEIE